MSTKVHRLVVCIIDHDNLGPEQVAEVLENARYPNRCINPDVVSIETAEVEWSDDHPLNMRGTSKAAFAELFAAKAT